MKHYFCRFNENGAPIVLVFCENRIEAETENARYLTEDELPLIQNRISEMIEEQERTESDTEKTYVEQLEAENAALLFQLLTGEEFSDV